jgi:hypothetical protein
VGLGASLAALRRLAARRPEAVLAGGGAVLVLWNVLFMEQYRRGAIPRDDTVSFARVAFNSADVFAAAFGSPVAWPANWIFSLREGLPPDRYDLMVGKYLFFMQNNLGGVIDVGADPGLDQSLSAKAGACARRAREPLTASAGRWRDTPGSSPRWRFPRRWTSPCARRVPDACASWSTAWRSRSAPSPKAWRT